MADTRVFTARPVTRKSALHRKLVPSLARDSAAFENAVDHTNFMYLLAVREHYRLANWKWNRGAEFLFSCLINALDLGDYENRILSAARPARGARPKTETREYIKYLKGQGRNVIQIQTVLKETRGINLSRDAIRDNLKPPRKRSKEEVTGRISLQIHPRENMSPFFPVFPNNSASLIVLSRSHLM